MKNICSCGKKLKFAKGIGYWCPSPNCPEDKKNTKIALEIFARKQLAIAFKNWIRSLFSRYR